MDATLYSTRFSRAGQFGCLLLHYNYKPLIDPERALYSVIPILLNVQAITVY